MPRSIIFTARFPFIRAAPDLPFYKLSAWFSAQVHVRSWPASEPINTSASILFAIVALAEIADNYDRASNLRVEFYIVYGGARIMRAIMQATAVIYHLSKKRFLRLLAEVKIWFITEQNYLAPYGGNLWTSRVKMAKANFLSYLSSFLFRKKRCLSMLSVVGGKKRLWRVSFERVLKWTEIAKWARDFHLLWNFQLKCRDLFAADYIWCTKNRFWSHIKCTRVVFTSKEYEFARWIRIDAFRA